jgi:hypothetical protein
MSPPSPPLGASITFVLVISDIKDPHEVAQKDAKFDSSTVRIFLATSWLLFILDVGCTPFLAGFVRYYVTQDTGRWDEAERVSSTVLFCLLTGAFMKLSLTVVAYVAVVGYIAVALTSCFAVLFALTFCPGGELLRGSGAGQRRHLE